MTRIFPSDHESVRQYLRDFRVAENGQRWIARLRGEGKFRSTVFPELREKSPQVLVELIPVASWRRPSFAIRWLTALRLPYLTISLFPLLLVLSARLGEGGRLSPAHTILLLTSVSLIHLACNLWSDFEDHIRGVDLPGQSGGSGVIQNLWIPAIHLRNAAAVLFLFGCAWGALLLGTLPAGVFDQRLLLLGIGGALGAANYSGWPFHYKYLGLGEPVVFLLSGPLVTAGAAALFYPDNVSLLRYAVLSLPLSFLVTLRLHSGNMQRIPFDSIARVHTIARLFGFDWSKRAYLFLTFMPFVLVFLLIGAGFLQKSASIAALALPLALLAVNSLKKVTGPLDPACSELRRKAAWLHLSFGLLYCLSFLFR